MPVWSRFEGEGLGAGGWMMYVLRCHQVVGSEKVNGGGIAQERLCSVRLPRFHAPISGTCTTSGLCTTLLFD